MLSIASVEPASGTERAVPKTFGKLIDVSRTVSLPMIPRLKMWKAIGTDAVNAHHVCRVTEKQISRIETVSICRVESQGQTVRKD